MRPSFRLRSRTVRAACLGSLVLLSTLATPGCSENAPARTSLITAVPDARWTACATHKACEARWLPCRGWRAVNRDHGRQVEAWYAQTNSAYLSRADCDGRPFAAPVAFCRAGQCSLE